MSKNNSSPLSYATDGITKMDIIEEEKEVNLHLHEDEPKDEQPSFHIPASNINTFGNLVPLPTSYYQQQQPQQQQQQQQQQFVKSASLPHSFSTYIPSSNLSHDVNFNTNRSDEQPKSQQQQQQQQQTTQQQPQQQTQTQQQTVTQENKPQLNSYYLPTPTNARDRLKEFKQVRVIGTGTFGKVYLVQNVNDRKFYAMKCLNKAYVVQLKQVEHLNSEKSILASINHPFIVNLYQAFQDEKKLYLLFEYVAGGEVFTHLRRSMKFSNSTAKFYAAEIVLALEFLHKQNIVYRDLKPENLLIDNEGHIKITDFGFAKRVEDRTFTLCGTPEYLAPEIIQSKGHGKAVDWWALGILIFEMLAGYPPFYDDDTFAIYNKILAGRITFPLGFDVDAKDLIKRLLTADRTRRLGALKDGALDVKNHRWFSDIDWDSLYNRNIPGPFIPNIQHQGDSSNFELYEEEDMIEEPPSPGFVDPYIHLFKDF